MDENDEFSTANSPPSLKQKLKNSLCFSCCFPHRRPQPPQPSSSDENPGLMWVNREEPNNLKDKVLTVLNLKRHSSTEFRYDPLSYSLNFEDVFGNNDEEEEEAPLRNFSSRLPPSPPISVREVTAAT